MTLRLTLLIALLPLLLLCTCCGCAAAGGHRVTTSQPVTISQDTAAILAKAEATLSAVANVQSEIVGMKTDVTAKLLEIHNARTTTYNCGNPWLLGFVASLVFVMLYAAWKHDPRGK